MGSALMRASDSAPPQFVGVDRELELVLEGEAAAPLFLGFNGDANKIKTSYLMIFMRILAAIWVRPCQVSAYNQS